MRTRNARAALAAAALPVVLGFLTACGGGGGGRTAPVVPEPPVPNLDLVALAREDAVLVFRDVMHKSFGQVADLVLDRIHSEVDRPTGAFVWGDTLFVSSFGSNHVLVFEGFSTLTSGAPPTKVLSGVYGPNRLLVAGQDLYVCCQSSGTVEVFRDVATLATGDVPDVSLSGLGYCKDLAVGDDTLFVAGYGDDSVYVFHGLAGLTTGRAPDAVLDLMGSFLRQPIRLTLDANTLYVSGRYNSVCVFRNASAVVSSQAPDVVLGGPSALDGVRRVLVSPTRLFIPNQWEDVGFAIFDDPATLTMGQPPDATLTDPAVDVSASDLLRNVLAGFSRDREVFFFYRDAEAITTGQAPDLQLWDPRALYEDVGEILLVDRTLQ